MRKPQSPQAILELAGLLWITRFLREADSDEPPLSCAVTTAHFAASRDRLLHFLSLAQRRNTPCARNSSRIEVIGLHHYANGLVRG